MRKIAAIVSTLLVASALGHGHKKEANVTAEVWRDIKILTTFKMDVSLYGWVYDRNDSKPP